MTRKYIEKGKIISSCNNHIGGLLGEAILKYFLKERLIKKIDDEYEITDNGWEELEIIGIDVEKLRNYKRKIVNICIEINHGILYEHIGSYLGALLFERMFELGWFIKRNETKYELTDKGIAGLESLGICIKTITKW